MANDSTPHIANLAIGAAVLYVVYLVIARIDLERRRAFFKRQHGCQAPVHYPQTFWDRLTGISEFQNIFSAARNKRVLQYQVDRHATAGSTTFEIRNLFRTMHSTLEPDNLKTIQATDAKKWSLGRRRIQSFTPFLGKGIFTTDGAEWAHSREMLRPNFVRSQVGDLATFETHIGHLIAAVPKDGSTVDLSELFFRLTMDSATEFLFGESTDTLSKSSLEGFAGAFNRCQEHVADTGRTGMFAKFMPENKQFKRDRQLVYDMVDHYVDKGLAKRNDPKQSAATTDEKSTGRYVFIDELVRQTSDRVQIRSELLNILLAGRDTTASLLTNVFFTLSHNPHIWSKLQSEIRTALPDDSRPTFEQLKNMKYLKAILNESLRMHPVVPANSREAVEDTVLPLGGGPDGNAPLFVPKGGVVLWSVYGMHRRSEYYGSDSETFRPERWLDDPETGKKGLRPGWEYLPFNGGARICLGQQFALTEASYATVRLCQAFKGIESRDATQGTWTEGLTLTCVNSDGAKVALTPREA